MRWPQLSAGDYEFLACFEFAAERSWDDDLALSDAAVGRVMLLGDIHNSREVLEAALRTAAAEGCDALVQVGDFWLQDRSWRGLGPEQAAVMLCAVRAAVPVVVIDGNHEVWPCLTAFLGRDATVEARATGRPLHLGGSLWWADRGSVWDWSNKRFGALGGTVSPDKWHADVKRWRWPAEMITQQDVDRLVQNAVDGLDVLISHDAPIDALGLIGGAWMPPSVHGEAVAAQLLVQEGVDATGPALVFHGHWHQQNRCRLPDGAEVIGLAADGHPASAAVLSISDLQAHYLDPSSARTAGSRPNSRRRRALRDIGRRPSING